MSNCIAFVGRIGSDPELKEVSGSSVLNFRIANDTGFGDRKNTNWFRCGYWGKRAVSIKDYLEKGKQIFIIGELTLREYEKDGEKRFSPEVNVSSIDFVGGRNNDEIQPTPETEEQRRLR